MKHDADMLGVIKEIRKNRVFDGLCVDCPYCAWGIIGYETDRIEYYECKLDKPEGNKRHPDQVCQMDRKLT
jgi:hypothetical protein